jgi:hypothetical protein
VRILNRRSAVALLLLICSMSILPAGAASGYSQNNRWVAVQYNVYGAKGGTGYNEDIAPAVVNYINDRTPKPAVISFNEICWWQWDFIESYLQQTGYQYVPFAHWSINTNHPDCDGTIFGNVIVSLGTGPPAYGTDIEFAHQLPGAIEKRGAACLSNLIGNWTACSTHLAPTSGVPFDADPQKTTKEQLADLMIAISGWAQQGVPMYILGDLNIETTYDATTIAYFRDWWYVLFAEADTPGGTYLNRRLTFESFANEDQGSFDYMFRRNPNVFTDRAFIYFGPYSDHAWYEGFLT